MKLVVVPGTVLLFLSGVLKVPDSRSTLLGVLQIQRVYEILHMCTDRS